MSRRDTTFAYECVCKCLCRDICLRNCDLRHRHLPKKFRQLYKGQASASPRPLRMLASASRVSSSSRALAAPPAVTHILLPRAPLFRRLPSSRRGEALWERVEAGSGSPGAASSELAGYWGNFQYKKREISIQDIIIYHHISCCYHDISLCIIFSIMSLFDKCYIVLYM